MKKAYILFKARKEFETILSWKLLEGYYDKDTALRERDTQNATLSQLEHRVGWYFEVTEVDIIDADVTSQSDPESLQKLQSPEK